MNVVQQARKGNRLDNSHVLGIVRRSQMSGVCRCHADMTHEWTACQEYGKERNQAQLWNLRPEQTS